MDRRIALLVNPSAGGGRAGRVLGEVEAALRDLALPFHTERTQSLDHARVLAHAAVDAGETIVALSGDGLIGCLAGALHDRPAAVMGLLPGGRGNDFARVLGIPLDDMRAACAVLAAGHERALDLGHVDGDPFVGIASVGFDSDANRIANEAPAFLGGLVYAYGALRALATWRPARFELEFDGAPARSITGYSVAGANSRAFGGGMFLAPDADLEDGLLDVVVISEHARRRYLANIPKVFKGAHVHEPEVEVLRAREVRISADRPFDVYADGDPIAALPATIGVLPAAIRVVCPA